MQDSNSGGSRPENRVPDELLRARDRFLRSRGKGRDNDSGHYRRHAERELTKFIDHLTDTEGITALDELDVTVVRGYADHLSKQGHSARTTHKYYGYVSAWLGWAQREGLVSEHYGIQQRAREPLPDIDTRAEERQQSWHRDQRQQLLSHVQRRAHDAVDEHGSEAYAEVRDRALVHLLAYAGLRGSELLSNSQDSRRTGADWRDLGDDLASLEVLGKTQEWETRSIPPQARDAIEQWRRVLDPEPGWPIVPSLHYPSLYSALREAGVDGTDDLQGHSDVFQALRESGGRPPAMTTDGARRLLKRFTDEAGIDVEEEYLQLHGARRGVGRVLALQQGADAAADQLGNSVAVVEDAYSDVLASERAELTGDAFEKHDG